MPLAVAIPEPGRALALRTWLPRRANGGIVDLDPAVLEGLRVPAEGPGGYLRRETTQQRLTLGGEDSPRGIYTLSLSAPAPLDRAPRLTVRLTWTFPGGRVLPLPPSPLLEPGRPLPVLMGGPVGGSVQPLRLQVPEDGAGFVLHAATTGGANVDLYVWRGTATHRKEETSDWFGVSVGPQERVVVGGHGKLAPGPYTAEVVLVEDRRPVEVVVALQPILPGAGPFPWGERDPEPLSPDDWAAGSVRVFESAVAWRAVDAPEGATSIHAQLLDSWGPLELVLLDSGEGRVVARAFTPLVDEQLSYALPAPLPEGARFFLGVVNRAIWDEEVQYRVAVAFDRAPGLPEGLTWPPAFRRADLTVAERTAAATVEVTIGDCSGGSGVCVTPDGLVLSCRHCLRLKEVGGVRTEGVLVAFPRDLEAPPVQTYYARILDEDPARDLVLLVPIRDVFNREIPADVDLPYVAMGDDVHLRLGGGGAWSRATRRGDRTAPGPRWWSRGGSWRGWSVDPPARRGSRPTRGSLPATAAARWSTTRAGSWASPRRPSAPPSPSASQSPWPGSPRSGLRPSASASPPATPR